MNHRVFEIRNRDGSISRIYSVTIADMWTIQRCNIIFTTLYGLVLCIRDQRWLNIMSFTVFCFCLPF